MCDHFTKCIVLYAIPYQKTESVASKIVKFSIMFGFHESILTTIVGDSLETLDVYKLRTSSIHLQTDGLTKRINRTEKEMLTKFLNEA